jgi:hypothetical protein
MQATGPEISITEGTVAPLVGVRVGVGNVWVRDYELPDKRTRTGMSAMIFVEGASPTVVGEGSVFTAGGVRWLVLGVTAEEPRGSVRVAPVP